MICSQCQTEIPGEAKFCPGCGSAAPIFSDRGAVEIPAAVAQRFWQRLDQLASVEKLEGFSLRELFSEVFKKRTPSEIDDYFLVGTYRTTPSIESVETGWPKPWVFGRVLLFVVVIYLVLYITSRLFPNNPLILPAVMITGALAMPFATAFLFFEINVWRNVSFRQTLMFFCEGGAISLLITLFLYETTGLLTLLGSVAAGPVEETGKLLAVIIVTRNMNKQYILNGCLFGASVGAAFAVFESAGYAFEAWRTVGASAMTHNILLRGFLSPFAHVPWTAIAAGALWRARATHGTLTGALSDRRFLGVFVLVVALHSCWDLAAEMGLGLWAYGAWALIGVVSWHVVFGIVQQGLRQLKAAQKLAMESQNIEAEIGPTAASS